MEPMPQDANNAMPSMGGDMGMDDEFSGNGNNIPNTDNGNSQSQFDTNFDAGIDADEDTDPKKYIQQLTGKLSQTLSTYNNENGDDSELSKYVGKMIVKQAAKGLDDEGKKELIKAINTSSSDSSDESDVDASLDDGPEDNIPTGDDNMEEPVQEECYTVGKIDEILGDIINGEKEVRQPSPAPRKQTKSPFNGKQYK